MLAYWAEHNDFPHQSTAEQFFEESQFESYRTLGEQIVSQAFADADNTPAGDRLTRMFERAETVAREIQQAARTLAPSQKPPPNGE